jgi:hypothetical protein
MERYFSFGEDSCQQIASQAHISRYPVHFCLKGWHMQITIGPAVLMPDNMDMRGIVQDFNNLDVAHQGPVETLSDVFRPDHIENASAPRNDIAIIGEFFHEFSQKVAAVSPLVETEVYTAEYDAFTFQRCSLHYTSWNLIEG